MTNLVVPEADAASISLLLEAVWSTMKAALPLEFCPLTLSVVIALLLASPTMTPFPVGVVLIPKAVTDPAWLRKLIPESAFIPRKLPLFIFAFPAPESTIDTLFIEAFPVIVVPPAT